MANDVFISYRREDNRGTGRELAEALRRIGFTVFFDQQNITPGEAFPDTIKNAINDASDFLIIVSESYFGCSKDGRIRIFEDEDWCYKEIRCALKSRKHIIPIVLDPAFFRMPVIIGSSESIKKAYAIRNVFDTQYIDYSNTEDTDKFIQKLQTLLSPTSISNSKRTYYSNELDKIIRNEDITKINIAIRNLVISLTEEIINDYFYPILNGTEEKAKRFYTYYAIFTFYRRLEYHTKVSDLVSRYGDAFDISEFPLNCIVRSQYYRYLHESSGRTEDLDQAIHYAGQAKKRIDNNSGVYVNYAELITTGCKTGDPKYREFIPEAIGDIHSAMRLNANYPKHYYILGMLESETGQFDEGIRHIQKAIEIENSEKKDAYLRVIKYYDAIHDIHLKQMEIRILNAIDERIKGK